MSKILVTGAAGFIGSQLAHKFWQEKENVVLLDNFSYGKYDNLVFEDHDFTDEIIHEDIRNVSFMKELFKKEKFDYVYNIAAVSPLPDCQTDPVKAIDNNVTGLANILELSRKYGVKNVIFSSTAAVYENCDKFPTKEEDVTDPTLVYSTSKYMSEKLCKAFVDAYDMNVTVLRFTNVYGPHVDCLRTQPPVAGYIIRQLHLNRTVELHSDGNQKRDFIYIDDLLELASIVKESKGYDVFNVSSNETHSINEMYKTIVDLMKIENPKVEYLPTEHYWYRYPKLYEGEYPIKKEIMDNEVLKYTLLDNSHAKEKFGWEPKVSFKEGLKKTIEFSIKVLDNAPEEIKEQFK